ncbi:MAG: hypothetical protein ACUVTE_05740 [Candidatus Bathycorpusculaceae bacterium]
MDVEITSISPSTQTGKVGDFVQIIGTINSTGGSFRIWFGSIPVASGTALGNDINASFRVPTLPNGNYTITLHDEGANVNATSWFYIETDYILKISKPPHPQQLQEGAAVNISVSLTGGRANTVYTANVTVKTPANETYWKLVPLSNTGDAGIGNATITYPNDFGGAAHTNYTGMYTVSLNGTLASDTFFIGLTNLAEYHRGDAVKIKAVDYSSLNNHNVTITIKFGNKIIDRFNQTVVDGVIDVNWAVPNSVVVGNYTLSITPTPPSKKVNDTQVFAVPGFKTEIVTLNLAGEPTSNVLLRVSDVSANTTYNVTSGGNGVASARLEKGSYNSTAFFKRVRVSESLEFEVADESVRLNLSCRLTSLNIIVASEQNHSIKIPFVSLNLTYNYITELDGAENKTETVFLQTDITGTGKLHLLLLNAVYRVNASRYGKIFNKNNDTFSNLQPWPWNNIVIICPVKPLHVNVVDAKGQPIKSAMVEAQELMGGLPFINYTDQNGNATLNCIIGIYRLKVYSNGTLLKETTVELFDENSTIIYCALYNLPIYVKVVDYFGQPIPNANVTLERNGVKINSKHTGNNGIADFTEIGGNLTIKVYLGNQDQPALTFACSIAEARDETNPIKATLGNYVILAGFLVETAHFSMMVLAIAAIALFAIIEFGVRKRLKR